ncbi:hypothetical protein HanIR_Chr13g0659951 [Helianthus annuus]|nr:hypothetical protein HanIR_Chr13g0659951 [Helianthus annuus]
MSLLACRIILPYFSPPIESTNTTKIIITSVCVYIYRERERIRLKHRNHI